MEEELISQIKKLLEMRVGKIKQPLSVNTCIEEEIKIAGDDAYKFIVDFGKKFKVDVTQFKFSKYFSEEGFPFLSSSNKDVPKELTIGHLLNAIKAGKLDETVIENKENY